jgi:hypothetical protein
VDNSGYRERGAKIRDDYQAAANNSVAELKRTLPRTPGHAPFEFYQSLLARIRAVYPLTNAATCPPRSPKPM